MEIVCFGECGVWPGVGLDQIRLLEAIFFAAVRGC